METNEQLIIQIKAGIDIAGNMLKLWNNMECQVNAMAKKLKGYAELEDLKQEGFISLYDAISHYDESKGIKFSTYATYWIKMKMNRYICECTRGIKIHEKTEYARRRYKKCISEYEKEYGKSPKRGEICHILNIDIETLDKIEKIENLAKISSVDIGLKTENGHEIGIIDIIPGEENESTIIKQIDDNMLKIKLWEVVENLPDHERDLITFRYREELSSKELVQKMNICEKDISGIHIKAIKRLRKSNHIRQYYDDYVAACAYHHIGVAAYNTTWESITERVALRL